MYISHDFIAQVGLEFITAVLQFAAASFSPDIFLNPQDGDTFLRTTGRYHPEAGTLHCIKFFQ